LKLEN